MISLALGIALWACAHLATTMRLGFRDALIAKLDANKYKGLFSLAMVVALGLIVIGWQSADSLHVYDPPFWNSPIMIVLMWLALFLFVAARAPNNAKRFIRHPQLTGVMVWAGAHLLANGDNRSLLLFGGLGLWALLEVILINRREGAWVKPDAVPITRDLIVVGVSGVLVVVLMLLHPYFAGMPIQFSA
ncbi:MAG: NnrU family protein [Pseudomonadota bacterium]